MNSELFFNIMFSVVGGLGIFLVGMKYMSEGMQTVAGDKIRKMINAVTNNRVIGCGIGTGVTAIIQSSSVTTVIVVGMVNAGLMTLTQAINVILGANIGTTMTAWIVSMKVTHFGLPMLGFAALFYLFSRNDRLKFWAAFAMGLGMVFFGLELMSDGFKPLRTMPAVHDWFKAFSPMGADGTISYFSTIRCCLVGAAVTAIVQSSSATIAITITLAAQGAIDYYTAAALVLGENIGTTITAILASFGASTNAKRASMAHVCFNIVGVLWITSIFSFYVKEVVIVTNWMLGYDTLAVTLDSAGLATYPSVGKTIAATHTGFNVINTIAMLPLTGLLAKFLTSVIPDKKVKETPHLRYLDIRMVETPVLAIEQSHKEIIHMARMDEQMMDLLKNEVEKIDPGQKTRDNIFNKENIMDNIQKEVVVFLSKALTGNVSLELAEDARDYIRLADDYESISDYITAILKLYIKLENNNLTLHPEGIKAFKILHSTIFDYLKMINDAVEEGVPDILTRAQTRGATITHQIKQFRAEHLERVSAGSTTPFHSFIFADILNSYRKIKDHTLSIAETIAGEK
ncbi:MAG: Na/Pi cotransporter family protein [Sedimentisphaerales bacterium]|nr:Na/Pi cotransporter family protein [Sedimentisphaerales bacterium]MBN2843933.1 Na/Pi cotransporter family protein [Sedimentisphaerales bacterium]